MGKARDLANVGSVASSGLQFRNKIINGACTIDQRTNGGSVSYPSGSSGIVAYNLDRWVGFKQTNLGGYTVQRSTNAPAGFTNSIAVTISSGYAATESTAAVAALAQFVEGFNVADLGWGTANAQPITVSFWVRSSVTGSYTFLVGNDAYNRQYPTAYTVNAANTWEYKTVTIPGDTTGTWTRDNSAGLRVWFDLGTSSNAFYTGTANTWASTQGFRLAGTVQLMATNGATFFLTGVQLEKGTQATPFEHRPIGTELALCQRYFSKSYLQSEVPGATNSPHSIGRFVDAVSSYAAIQISFPQTMRAIPTVTGYDPSSGTVNRIRTDSSSLPASVSAPGPNGCFIHASNAAVGYTSDSTRVHFTASAEL
jgi:hypothetical protein